MNNIFTGDEPPTKDDGMELAAASEVDLPIFVIPKTIEDSQDYSREQFFRRPCKLTTFNWTTASTTSYTTLTPLSNTVPMGIILNETGANAYFASSNKFLTAGTLCIRATVNGTIHHTGCLVFSYCPNPFRQAATTSSIPVHISQRLTLPHFMLEPNTGVSKELKIPFMYDQGKMLVSNAVNYGTLQVHCLIPLNVWNATVATTVTVRVDAWLEGAKFSNLIIQSESQGFYAKTHGLASKFARGVADASLTYLGLGSPLLNNGKIYSKSDVMPTWKSNAVPSGQSLSTREGQEDPIDWDEHMDFKTISSVYGMIGLYSWSTSSTGASLLSVNVTPMIQQSITTGGTGVVYSPAGFIALPFTYWRGDITYRLTFYCPTFGKGRLRIFHSVNSRPPFDDTYQQPNHTIVDVHGTTQVEFTCPYVGDDVWLEAVSATGVETYNGTRFSGVLYVDIIEPLVLPVSTPTSINFTLEMKCPNLQVARPDPLTLKDTKLGYQNVFLQSEINLNEYTTIRDMIKFPTLAKYWNLSAFTDTANTGVEVLQDDSPFCEMVGGTYETNCPPVTFTTLLAYYTAAFLVRRGGIRHHFNTLNWGDFTVSSNQTIMKVASTFADSTIQINMIATPQVANHLQFAGQGAAFQSSTEPTAIIFDSPLYTPGYFASAQMPHALTTSSSQRKVWVTMSYNRKAEANTDDIVVYAQSGADDYSLGYFLFCPPLYN